MKSVLLLPLLLLVLSVSATTRVFWISSGGVVAASGTIYLGDTIAWANMTSYEYNISCRLSPSGNYPFLCDFSVTCKYIPPVPGHYTFNCTSPDYTHFSDGFYVIDPTAIIDQKLVANSFKYYPNPAANELTVYAPEKITHLSISNMVGQEVYHHAYNTEMVKVDVSTLPNGVYFVKVNGMAVRKFVKQ